MHQSCALVVQRQSLERAQHSFLWELMPPVRRSQKNEQRLSDFFPPLDALSPIAPKTRSAKNSPIKTTSTPAPRRKRNATRKSRKADVQSTPVFDPDQSFSEAEADTSDEEEFIKSVRFSPVKSARLTPATQSTPADRNQKDYEVIVDYNSDSDGFAFSPVKFTPMSVQNRQSRKIKGTPMPLARLRETKKMVWNSATKKVEECTSKVYVSSPLKRPISSASGESSKMADAIDLVDAGQSSENFSTQSGQATKSQSTEVEVRGSPAFAESSRVLNDISGPPRPRSSSIRPIANEMRSPDGGVARDEMNSGTAVQKLDDEVEEYPRPAYRRRPSMLTGPRRANASKYFAEPAPRSPPVRLTRAVSGTLPLQKLETLALPDYVLAEEPDGKQKKRQKPYARVPKKIPVTVPKPFHLSENKPRGSSSGPDGLANKENVPEESQGQSRRSSAAQVGNKRKAETTHEEEYGLKSPAKRLKVDDGGERKIAPLRRKREVIRARPTMPTFEFSSEAAFRQRSMQREARLRQQAEDESGLRQKSNAGRVPRTLYSPEKQAAHRNASPTRPQPFHFSTEARAVRSPLAKTPIAIRPVKHLENRVRVPALELAPFVPKPSNLPITVAASPVRKLPNRLETRREFDKLAGRHAEQVVQRKRREEELLAAERERKIEERRGWKSMGMAAVENWAARAKITSDGKRDWVD